MAIAAISAATAHAAEYKMVNCASNSGAPPYTVASNTGIFTFENDCVGQGGDPPGNASFLRISEHESGGNAAYGAYLSFTFETPTGINFRSAGGYLREPNAFNDGWQARFGFNYMDGSPQLQLVQGAHLEGSGQGYWGTTPIFGSYLWPWPYPIDFFRWTFEMICASPSGCDRSNYNAVDLNGIAFTLRDWEDSHVDFTNTGSDLMQGNWVKGAQNVSWESSDKGSGLRMERLRVDGAERYVLDYGAINACDTSYDQTNGTFARTFQPCPTGGPFGRSYNLDTANLGDGAHTAQVCTQDFAQWQGLNGTGGETCTQRTIRTDNTAPGAPSGLSIVTSNPNRYEDHFGVKFSLPPNSGSPIARVHYRITDESGKAVAPEKVVSATNPTSVSGIEGPAKAGAYTLHVSLEDQIGFIGPVATVSIPHDTTPPAAPQDLRVLGSTAHKAPKFDVQWDNITDDGSPIETAYYQVVEGSGKAVGPTRSVSGDNVQTIQGIETPPGAGSYRVRVWLSDQEGNEGAASSVPVPGDTTPPAAPQSLSVTAPSASRGSQGFDVRWRNIVDDGSPITAAHYRVVNAAGTVVVPPTTVSGSNIQAIADLDTPRDRGVYTLVLWLSDEEGNAGAPAEAPLAYSCVKADDSGASSLTAGLGKHAAAVALLHQGHDTTLDGELGGGPHANVPICVFSRVVTDSERQFLGVALTNSNGDYQFSVPAGPSRELAAVYRPGQRELSAQATLRTKVRPSFRLVHKVVRNKGYATFKTAIPGPRKKNVVILLQVKSGKAWRVFRRCRTGASGRCLLRYRFTQTPTPTVYIMRAQVRAQSGYPYQQGSSKARRLRVVPSTSRARKAR